MGQGVAATEQDGNTFAARVWLAWHSLPRGDKGRPPRQIHLEREHGISQGTFSRLFSGYIRTVEPATLIKVARAVQADPTWLVSGIGIAPTATGVVPPMPGTLYAPERTPEEQCVNRATAAEIARAGGVGEDAVRSVLLEAYSAGDDRPVLWWIDRMRLRELMLRSQAMKTDAAQDLRSSRARRAS